MLKEYTTLMLSQKYLLAERWLHEVGSLYADEQKPFLIEDVLQYIEYIFDFETPMEQHAFLDRIPEWSMHINRNYNYIEYILNCTMLWRKLIYETSEKLVFEKITYQDIQKIIVRMDLFQKLMCEFYWKQTQKTIMDKENEIKELHNERLNLVGKMAASMAHEIRNPLTSMQGFLKLIKENLQPDKIDRISNYITIVEDEFRNINMQITGFLSFSKNQDFEEPFVNISLQQLINSVLSMLNPRLINENIRLTLGMEMDAVVTVQAVGIQQVISNLINNAIDALSESPYPKEIELSAGEDEKTNFLQILNNGPKINDEIVKTLFTPFVTSKTEGTGLGLAICKQIMKKNNGDITFRSSEEETIFILIFNKC